MKHMKLVCEIEEKDTEEDNPIVSAINRTLKQLGYHPSEVRIDGVTMDNGDKYRITYPEKMDSMLTICAMLSGININPNGITHCYPFTFEVSMETPYRFTVKLTKAVRIGKWIEIYKNND